MGIRPPKYLIALVSVVWLVGCGTWQARPEDPAWIISTEEPGRVRLHMPDSIAEVSRPAVSGDSIVGALYNKRVSYPIAAVSRIDVHESHEVRTAAVLFGGLLAALVIGLYIYVATYDY